jgi:hypothetical protein
LKPHHAESDQDAQPSLRAPGSVRKEAGSIVRLIAANADRANGSRSVAGRIGIWTEPIRSGTWLDLLPTKGSQFACEARAAGRKLLRGALCGSRGRLRDRDIEAGNVMMRR